ncbi:MAG TPA: hypothetical protein PK747_08770 [Acidobacteriota bacterium]|nr:hypothetical protein [Acidobacteriota bacterium]HNT16914.1 hypothetical protein [Acidobacteriota bacterium]HQO20700.1 hypothetical protein [Acidobacteriota bacterium]HQQ47487.1 hypothetical protein [Acidobacteriota bacterium]
MFGIRRRGGYRDEKLKILRAFLVLSIVLLSTGAFAYGEKTTEKMVDSAVWLAPPSLKGLLTAFRKDTLSGVRETLDTQSGKQDVDLCLALEEEMALLPKLASKQSSFEQIAFHFGKVAALVFLLDDPFRNNEDSRVKEISSDYKEYMERKVAKHILTFEGYASPAFEIPVSGYFEKRKAAFPRYVESVLFCYFPSGERVSSKTFDDRSNAFGVSQIVLSKSVSDAAKVWLHVWKSMDGDVSGTPFLKDKDKGKEKGKEK